jgi:chemotaxis methyl-accepting protein methylase
LLLADLLIGVTNFFRDPEAFSSFESTLLATLTRRPEAYDEIRAWVPACATGEEAFSIAIILDEVARRLPQRPRVTVYASDIDERAIAIAHTGNYPGSIANDISPVRRPSLRSLTSRVIGHQPAVASNKVSAWRMLRLKLRYARCLALLLLQTQRK